jgi:hypothetical protein
VNSGVLEVMISELGTSKNEDDSEEVEILEPPPIPIVDLVSEDEVTSPLPCIRER